MLQLVLSAWLSEDCRFVQTGKAGLIQAPPGVVANISNHNADYADVNYSLIVGSVTFI